VDLGPVVRSVLTYWFWTLIPALLCFVPIWFIRRAEGSFPDDPWPIRVARVLLPLLLACSWLSLTVQMVKPWDGIGAMMEAWQEMGANKAGSRPSPDQVSDYLDRKRVLHRKTAVVCHVVLNIASGVALVRLRSRKPDFD
jgi:hypothetical protein